MYRVAYLISQYPTLSHTFIFREVAGLRRLGWQIEVASIRTPDRDPGQLTPAERAEFDSCYYIRPDLARWPLLHLKTFASKPGRYFAGLATAIRGSSGSIPQLLRNLRHFGEAIAAGQWAKRTGIVHVHTHFASFTALLVKCVFAIPFSVTLHGPDEFTDPAMQSIREKLGAASLAVAISHYGASQIMRFSETADWHKIQTIPLGIDPADFPLPEAANRSGAFRIVSVGRLAKVKGYPVLLRAFALVRSRFAEATLTVIGAGPERESLEQLARELSLPVEFAGGLPNELVRQRVAASQCFALASFAEGVPVVLMEAMALGVPCVATRVMGVPELIEHGEEGLLVNAGEETSLAHAIERLIEEPELYSRIRVSARQKILREYDLNRNVETLSAQLQAKCCDR